MSLVSCAVRQSTLSTWFMSHFLSPSESYSSLHRIPTPTSMCEQKKNDLRWFGNEGIGIKRGNLRRLRVPWQKNAKQFFRCAGADWNFSLFSGIWNERRHWKAALLRQRKRQMSRNYVLRFQRENEIERIKMLVVLKKSIWIWFVRLKSISRLIQNFELRRD